MDELLNEMYFPADADSQYAAANTNTRSQAPSQPHQPHQSRTVRISDSSPTHVNNQHRAVPADTNTNTNTAVAAAPTKSRSLTNYIPKFAQTTAKIKEFYSTHRIKVIVMLVVLIFIIVIYGSYKTNGIIYKKMSNMTLLKKLLPKKETLVAPTPTAANMNPTIGAITTPALSLASSAATTQAPPKAQEPPKSSENATNKEAAEDAEDVEDTDEANNSEDESDKEEAPSSQSKAPRPPQSKQQSNNKKSGSESDDGISIEQTNPNSDSKNNGGAKPRATVPATKPMSAPLRKKKRATTQTPALLPNKPQSKRAATPNTTLPAAPTEPAKPPKRQFLTNKEILSSEVSKKKVQAGEDSDSYYQ